MSGPLVLARGQGTTSTKAVIVNASGEILARASAPLTTEYPQNGWAEPSADAIWASVQAVIADLVAITGSSDIAAMAIANQRETLVTRDADTRAAIHPAMLWQCRRTADVCASLIAAGHDAAVVAARLSAGTDLLIRSPLGAVPAG